MVENITIDREYMIKLDKEIKDGIRNFIPLYNDRFIKSLFYKNIILLKKFLIYILDLNLDPYDVNLEILNNNLL